MHFHTAAWGGTLVALVAMSLLVGPLANGERDAFFRPAPNSAQHLDATQVYPRGRLFPYGGFSIPPDLLDRAKESGFTLMGPYYSAIPQKREIEESRSHALPLIYRVGVSREDLEKEGVEWAVAQVRGQVEEVCAHREIAWWYLTPEELRYWRSNEIQYLEQAAKAIRETDPQRRPVWMYDPNHRNATALAHTARHLDILGKGFYANYAGFRTMRAWIRWSIEQEVAALREANSKAIPIAVPMMFTLGKEEDPKQIPAWVRHDVYLSLVHGAKGVVIWSLARRSGFVHHSDYLEAYLQVARELAGTPSSVDSQANTAGFLGLGQVFLFGERRHDLQVHTLEGPAQVEVKFRENTVSYPSISFLDVAYGAQRYLFLVNSANEKVRVQVEGVPLQARIADAFGKSGAPSLTKGTFTLSLDPLEVRAYRFSATK